MLKIILSFLFFISSSLVATTNSEKFVVVLLGPPGAGKGSQAALIKEQMQKQNVNLGHISTGDLLRDQIKRKTPLGLKVQELIDKGQLVADDLILDMLFERVKAADCSQGYILDGFPRTLAQADAFQKRLDKTAKLVAIHLNISDDAIVERLSKRVVCETCQTPFHLTFAAPKQPGICDKCNGKLIQRNDDKADVIKKRLEAYHQQTEPLVRFYSQLTVLHPIDATASKETVLASLIPLLKANKVE